MSVVVKKSLLFCAIVLGAMLLSACQNSGISSNDFSITVDVDGERLVYRYSKYVSVGQFLEEIGVALGDLDEVNPLLQTQVRDKMRITVTRVTQHEECETTPIPFGTDYVPTQSLSPGQEQLVQTGEEGQAQVCYRITEKNGVQTSRDQVGPPIVLTKARNEIIYVGSQPPETLIPIEGVLTYLSGGQAWIIQGNTANLNPLTEDGYLDGRVFELSQNGRQLLYTRSTADEDDPEFSNELWAILDTTASFPRSVQLVPEDVRSAQWVPGQPPYTVSYSTANPISDGAGWRAYNDLYLMRLNPETGASLAEGFREVIAANSLGSYAYWGRRLTWSPDGTYLGWANADSLGVVDLDEGSFVTLLTFPEYAPLLERPGGAIWVPSLAWSDDGHLIATMHGKPYADEGPEDSIIFDTAVVDVESGVLIDPFIPQVGIWSSVAYSPMVTGRDGNPTYSIAYLKARNPLNSPGTEYDLWVADRDGSNARELFPGSDKPGLRLPDPEDGIAWSPMARQIALIHQGNLWIIDVKSGQAYPITNDGQASHPRWSRSR